MDWTVAAALSVLGLALIAGLVICIVSSVNVYAKRFAEKPKDNRRGFEVKTIAAGQEPAALSKKDDHHG
jgi:hypothetical protein